MALLTDILGGSLLEGVKGIIGEFKLDPAKKAEMLAAADANATALQLKQLELQEKLQESISSEVASASANIRAEAQSGDKFTSRARPSFIYLMLAILGFNYIIAPLIGRPPLQFPDALFELFGFCMLGYTGARTWEKIAAKKEGV